MMMVLVLLDGRDLLGDDFEFRLGERLFPGHDVVSEAVNLHRLSEVVRLSTCILASLRLTSANFFAWYIALCFVAS